MIAVSPQQITAIRTLASRAGLDDDTYRDLLQREAGVRSAKALSFTQAGRVIERLRASAGDRRPDGAVTGLDSSVAKKMQALWLTGYNLGLIHDRTDRAMLAFLERQTGVSHTRFLASPSDATSAIEALKVWLRRDGGVNWPLKPRGAEADILDIKRAVIEAQWQRLLDLGGRKPLADLAMLVSGLTDGLTFGELESHHYDDVQRALGRGIRAALQTRRREAGHAR
jgi:hypothetical protein